eukprot:gene30872-6767_t
MEDGMMAAAYLQGRTLMRAKDYACAATVLKAAIAAAQKTATHSEDNDEINLKLLFAQCLQCSGDYASALSIVEDLAATQASVTAAAAAGGGGEQVPTLVGFEVYRTLVELTLELADDTTTTPAPRAAPTQTQLDAAIAACRLVTNALEAAAALKQEPALRLTFTVPLIYEYRAKLHAASCICNHAAKSDTDAGVSAGAGADAGAGAGVGAGAGAGVSKAAISIPAGAGGSKAACSCGQLLLAKDAWQEANVESPFRNSSTDVP